MNETVNTFLLARDKFVPEMHLHISLVVHSLKIKISKETGDSRYIYQNELTTLVFNMIWLMEILKIYIEEQLLIKY